MTRARPNVLLITSHDIGRHLGCYGVSTVSTPSLDRLAVEGVLMRQAFCAAPTCSPSRAAIFSGQYPNTSGVLGLCHGAFAWDMRDDAPHIAQCFAQAGYSTACFGVMHETRTPQRRGYQHLDLFDEQHRPDCDYYTAAAGDYLRQAASRGRPWMCHVGYFEPHHPFDHGGCGPDDSKGVTVPPYLADVPSARQELARFQGPIRKLDSAIGRLLAELQRLSFSQNTIVLFTADHGVPFPRAKASMYDPGMEVALMARWPQGGWCGGRRFDELISNVDIMPTLLEACEIPAPDGVQGQSFAPLLSGRGYRARMEVFCEQNFHGGLMFMDPRRAVRTDSYKLIANYTTASPWAPYPQTPLAEAILSAALRRNEYGENPHLELYDLRRDRLEMDNLACDAAYASVLADLSARLLRWMEQTGDPLLRGFPAPPVYHRTMQLLRDGAAAV
jgi:arylsulfatase A-like enzyme